MMRLLVVCVQLVIVMLTALGADNANAYGTPHLIASKVSGTLQIDRQGTIWIEIKNDANISKTAQDPIEGQLPDWLKGRYGINTSDAIGVDARIQPKDTRIRILSGPQEAGSLRSSENRTLEFNALVEGIMEPGAYPADLIASYRRLSDVQAAGDSKEPYVAFQYENISETIPISIDVIKGPRIYVDWISDSLPSGEESSTSLIFSNIGDLPARDLKIQILPQRPFASSSTAVSLGSMYPDQSAKARFEIKVENGTAQGVYPLMLIAGYKDGEVHRVEEVAALVSVRGKSENGSIFALTAGALGLTMLGAILYLFGTKRGPFGRRKKRDWAKRKRRIS